MCHCHWKSDIRFNIQYWNRSFCELKWINIFFRCLPVLVTGTPLFLSSWLFTSCRCGGRPSASTAGSISYHLLSKYSFLQHLQIYNFNLKPFNVQTLFHPVIKPFSNMCLSPQPPTCFDDSGHCRDPGPLTWGLCRGRT